LNKRTGFLVIAVFLMLVVAPVAVTQLNPPDRRQFDGAVLAEMQYEDISFRNEMQGITLGGMLFAPPGAGPFPAAVIIHGSGTSSRENRWYLTLTKHLQDNGIAVLLPDKRGSEKSQGNWRTSDFHDLATDTIAAIQYLDNVTRVDISRVGVIGMSQGGWIAPIVADQTENVAFLVSMVGSAATPDEQLSYEENYNLRQMGFLPGISNVITFFSTAYIRNVGHKEFYAAVSDYDPLPYWSKLRVDSLVLLGAEDSNVHSARSAARLRALENPVIDVRIFDGSGHALADPVGRGNRIIRREVLDEITDFILTN
jgi:dienelactone hydrolase